MHIYSKHAWVFSPLTTQQHSLGVLQLPRCDPPEFVEGMSNPRGSVMKQVTLDFSIWSPLQVAVSDFVLLRLLLSLAFGLLGRLSSKNLARPVLARQGPVQPFPSPGKFSSFVPAKASLLSLP